MKHTFKFLEDKIQRTKVSLFMAQQYNQSYAAIKYKKELDQWEKIAQVMSKFADK